jgi:carbon monoxide dehydrogenase subunit G
MEVLGEYQIKAPRQHVWEALNDPKMLEKCIPGCKSMQHVRDNEFTAMVTAKIGPVQANFNTTLLLEDLNPPESYCLVGKSKAAVGFGSGIAQIHLRDNGNFTSLSYKADLKVGGKLAQVGSRLVLGATKKIADDFFSRFCTELDVAAELNQTNIKENQAPGISVAWLTILGVILALFSLWFLLG